MARQLPPDACNVNADSSCLCLENILLLGQLFLFSSSSANNTSVFWAERVSERRGRVTQLRDLLLHQETCRSVSAVVLHLSDCGGGEGEEREGRGEVESKKQQVEDELFRQAGNDVWILLVVFFWMSWFVRVCYDQSLVFKVEKMTKQQLLV